MSDAPSRRLVVEVRSGPLLGHKRVLEPGDTLRVGRTERADLAFPADDGLSAVHFELSWDGAACRLRDLGSARGTLLSGAPVSAAAVPHGGWIKAGETSLSVHAEAHTPPFAPRIVDRMKADRALRSLVPRAGRLYAVLDAARDSRILVLLRESVDEARSLYEGVKGEALADVAPYLCAFRPGSGLLERLVAEGWGHAFGIFVESGASFKEVRRHFRRFLMVTEDATGARMYFRFYDPRVLRAFLPLATVRQRDILFADVVDAFLCEDEDAHLTVFPQDAARASNAAALAEEGSA